MTENPKNQVLTEHRVAELMIENAPVSSALLMRAEGDNIGIYLTEDPHSNPVIVDSIFILDPHTAVRIAREMEVLAMSLMGGIN